MNKKYLASLILLLAFTLSLDALAQRKTDVVTLYNGDRVTGEIKSLLAGILEFSTNGMGTIKIEWQEIASIQSQYHYEFRTTDGQRLFGSIEPSELPGQFVVTDLYGTHDFDWLEVVEVRPIEETFAERLDIYLSAGYSYTKASSVGQTTFNTRVSYEDQNSRNTLTGRTTITDTEDDTTSSNRFDVNRMLWTDRTKWFRTIFANYENNDELELEHRIGAGGGIGRYFVDTNQNRWIGVVGAQVINEKPLRGDDGKGTSSNQDVEMILVTTYDAWRLNTPELDLQLRFTIYPSITESGRVRTDSDIVLRWEIIEDLFFDITAWSTTDNEAESDRQTDYGITTGIGWEY